MVMDETGRACMASTIDGSRSFKSLPHREKDPHPIAIA
jgi:hypothetical protein